MKRTLEVKSFRGAQQNAAHAHAHSLENLTPTTVGCLTKFLEKPSFDFEEMWN